jgi:hypothetical protein
MITTEDMKTQVMEYGDPIYNAFRDITESLFG